MSRPVKKTNTKFLKSHEIDDMENISFIKKQKRKPATAGISNLQLKEIHPLTENQGKVFEAFADDKNVVCAGSAGTGKTFLLFYLCLQEMIYGQEYDKIIVFRSSVPTRNIGFLPGDEKEKMAAYEQPYKGICGDLFGRSDAYEILKKKDLVEFQSTSFVRGNTFDNCLIIVEEFQNLNYPEAVSLITRCGKNTKIFFSGDTDQCDFYKSKEESGFPKLLRIFNNMQSIKTVNFTVNDVVRSGFVKEFLLAQEKVNNN